MPGKQLFVMAESELIFHMYFNPKIFTLLDRPECIRGIGDGVLILFGRYWRKYYDSEVEIITYCRTHDFKIIRQEEPR